jgi:LmbE family N-acetylglucosaminyl deacetylase
MPQRRHDSRAGERTPIVLALMAHPDDIEITCAGTLILLQRAGWAVHLATMTAGDLGSMRHSRAAISRIRRREAARSAAVIGASYSCLGFDDLTIACDANAKRRVAGLLRDVRPDLLVTHPPADYMADHEETSRIAREAAFGSTIPNWRASHGRGRRPSPPCDALPAILYADPIDLTDRLGRRVPARVLVDVTAVIGVKERMLAAHDSQRTWLREQHGEDEFLLWMRRLGAARAREFRRRGVAYAEGFVPHLGHGFPHRDVLTAALGRTVVRTSRTVPGARLD